MTRRYARTVDKILVRADVETVFGLASDVMRWPEILPHYRWVRDLGEGGGGRIVEMAARRERIPVKWTSICVIDPGKHRVYYKHIGGATRGMEVEWILEDDEDGVRVTIVHKMKLEVPIVRSRLGCWITANFFVHHIAAKTLQCMKQLAEEGIRNCVVQ